MDSGAMAEEVVYAKLKPKQRNRTETPKPAGRHFCNSPYLTFLLLLTCIIQMSVLVWLKVGAVFRNSEDDQRMEIQQNLSQMLEDANQRVKCLRTVISAADQCSECPLGWTLVSHKCYFLSTDKKTREDSERFCAENEAMLATVRSKDSILKSYMKSKDIEFWVGLQQKVTWTGDVAETQWFWSDNTRELSIPSTPSTQCAKMEDIPVLSPCTDLLPWICERKPDKSNLLDKANAC